MTPFFGIGSVAHIVGMDLAIHRQSVQSWKHFENLFLGTPDTWAPVKNLTYLSGHYFADSWNQLLIFPPFYFIFCFFETTTVRSLSRPSLGGDKSSFLIEILSLSFVYVHWLKCQ